MPVNTEVKGTLARLLATENLKIEHRKVDTACFDVENRVLVLPIWKNASTVVYDMLVGHEVGHALYTPPDDYDAPKDFVNVLEDARIERMMKVTYPGLKHSFYKGYEELWNNDFFGVKHKDLTTISFIDRINLYFKGCVEIEFNEEEQSIVTRAGETKTFQDVVKLAEECYKYALDKEAQKEPTLSNLNEDSPNFGEEINIEQELDRLEDEMYKQDMQESETQQGDRPDLGEDDTEYEDEVGGTEGSESSCDETRAETDRSLRENLEDMIDDDAKEWIYLDLPKVDLKDCLYPWQQIKEDLEYHFNGQAFTCEEHQDRYNNSLEFTNKKYEDYKKSAQKSVNYLVKQFEMKKSADQYARASTAKTGVIDTNKLFSYKINEDIFKKVTVVPDGKNHGMIMLLDWSGSMNNVLMDTLKQVYNLVWFCRKVNIPFRVYAFQNGYDGYETYRSKPKGSLAVANDFKLLEFFSSRMNKQKLDNQMSLIWTQSWSMTAWSEVRSLHKLNLGGTPLAESCYFMRDAVRKLKDVEKVSKVNVVCLTDGEANPISFIKEEFHEYDDEMARADYLCHQRNKVFILRDPETGYSRRISTSPYETTKEIVSFFDEVTDYNWIGIRICSKTELTRLMQSTGLTYDAREKISRSWTKDKYAAIEKKAGFSKSFYIPNKGIGSGTEELLVKQKGEVATKAELGRAFKKHMGSKKTNKTILNAFIEQIA